jgi:hypothetical protein
VSEARGAAHALQGATWIAIAFAAMYALGAVRSIASVPFGLYEVSVSVRVTAGVSANLFVLALQIAVVVFAIHRAGAAPTRPPWVAIIVAAVAAFFAYPIQVGAAFVTTMAGARAMRPEALADLAMSSTVLSLVDGTLHALLLVGVLIAVALRWQRATERSESD